MTNWLDPAEVEAWLNRYSDDGREFVAKDNLIQALEQFVRSLADRDQHDDNCTSVFDFREPPERVACDCSLAVARLLVAALGEK